ncbi:DUF397 domain-containing protein [Virgisporangium ochraceum]|uniref:DUF397 domain-containing protein n=1 Tax=Virgisporangium ochraceum TaxID=65505 RepID=UPI0019429EC7|nr:DUF397 domain-containing protein [Virgisporangium ochraceum]
MPQSGCAPADGPVFRKSTRSTVNGNCIEVGIDEDHVQVRDSKLAGSPVLTFTRAAWSDLLSDLRCCGIS